jgi:hypothetical protein
MPRKGASGMQGCCSVTVLLAILLAVVMPVWVVILLGAAFPFALFFIAPVWLVLYVLGSFNNAHRR